MRPPEQPSFTPLAKGNDGPVFDEPWQVQVLALAFALADAGLFTPAQWSDALGAQLRAAGNNGAADNQATYYAAALAALEQLLAQSGGPDAAALADRVETWRRAYLNTPHGQPVELAAGSQSDST